MIFEPVSFECEIILNMQKANVKAKMTKQKTLCIETLDLDDQEPEEVRSLLEYLYLDVKVRSPQEVR